MLFRSMILSLLLVPITLGPVAAEPARVVPDPTDLGVPYRRYTTTDSLGRTITFYLSIAPVEKPEAKLPVVLWIQGSGCQSLFTKPGDKEHTLPRWAEANAAALKAAWTLPGVDAGRTLVIGHSEGAIVAARVAADLPGVTHVASLAGGGPTQLFSLAELASRPRPDGGTAAIQGAGLPRPQHERRGDPRNGLRPRPGRTRRSRPRRDGRTTRRRGSRISHRIDAERVAGRVASRLRARADVVPGGGGQAQMTRRTNRCSRRRPRFRFLGVQRLSARPPLPSFGIR